MDKNTILAAFSLPSLFILYGAWKLITYSGEGLGAIAIGLGIFVGIAAALAAGITLFALRSRQLKWWQGLLISIGSIIIAFGVLLLIGLFGKLTAPAPLPN